MRSRATFGLLVTALAVGLVTVASAQTDYVLSRYSTGACGYISPHGDSGYSFWLPTRDNAIGIMHWCMPPLVLPGMRCRVRVKWTVWTNHSPVTYVNYFGEWNKSRELARGSLYGSAPSPGGVYEDTFEFTAPSDSGFYRIRFMWVLAYDAVSNFLGSADPGTGPNAFSEIMFYVGPRSPLPIEEKPTPPTPKTADLSCSPNIFKAKTKISYCLSQSAVVAIRIHDRAGRTLRSIECGVQDSGDNSYVWDGRDDRGRELPAGAYFYEVLTDGRRSTGKVVLSR